MQQPLTYWKDPEGHIISEDKLIDSVIAGEYDGRIVVLDDYKGQGGIVPFRHPGMKMIRYDAWVEMAVNAIIEQGDANACLTGLFRQYKCVCLPDLDFLEGRDATTEVLVRAIRDVTSTVQLVLSGNQLPLTVPYLLELLGEHTVCFSICRNTP